MLGPGTASIYDILSTYEPLNVVGGSGNDAFAFPSPSLSSLLSVVTIVNSPGTVDAGYRGEIRVTLLNTDATAGYAIAVGDRIAQLIVQPVTRARFIPVERLPGSERGESGFGSTGYSTPSAHTGAAHTGAKHTGESA